MIRKLQSTEVPVMVEAAKMFFDEGKLPGGLKPEVFVATWQRLISIGTGVVFGMFGQDGAFHGALGAVHYPDPFNGHKCAIEQYWFVMPQFRGRGGLLLREFENWAKAEGCKRIGMIHLQRLQPTELRNFYERLGYEHIESAYIKDLQ
jgi:GNAT superfamily N-acetyltransferase